MLVSLHLKNIALIESLELSFKKGFTIFTGQTGAGKSILLESLNIVLGGKNIASDTRIVRSGSSFALIEASFSLTGLLSDWLKEQHIDSDGDDLVITREWRLKDSKYKSRSRINGILVNRKQIQAIRSFLLDFTLQGDTLSISNTANQLKFLDFSLIKFC